MGAAMAGSLTERPEVTQLKSKLQPLVVQDWISPATNPNFGVLNFTDAIPTLSAGAKLIKNFALTDFNILPPNRINTISQVLDQYQTIFNQIKGFDVRQGNPSAQRDSFINQLRDTYNRLFDALAIPIGLWGAAQVDVAAIKAELSSELKGPASDSEKAYQAALTSIETARQQATDTLVHWGL